MKLTFLYKPVCEIRKVKYKLLIVMKLTAILLLIGAMHLSAATYSQKVSVSRRNATLETVFQDIKKQTGYLFFYKAVAVVVVVNIAKFIYYSLLYNIAFNTIKCNFSGNRNSGKWRYNISKVAIPVVYIIRIMCHIGIIRPL